MGDAVVAETNNDRADDVEWDPKNKSVPIGWKIGKNKSTQQRVIQSSEGFFFDSRVKALQFMLNSSYHESLVNLMRYYLGEEGWMQDKPDKKDTELDENIKKEKISVESNRGNITLTT